MSFVLGTWHMHADGAVTAVANYIEHLPSVRCCAGMHGLTRSSALRADSYRHAHTRSHAQLGSSPGGGLGLGTL